MKNSKLILFSLFIGLICDTASASIFYSGLVTPGNMLDTNNNHIIIGNANEDLLSIRSQLVNQYNTTFADKILRKSGKTWYLNASITTPYSGCVYIDDSYCDKLYLSNQLDGVREGSYGLAGNFYIKNINVIGWNYTSNSVPDSTNLSVPQTDFLSIDLTYPFYLNNSSFEGIAYITLENAHDLNMRNIHLNDSVGSIILNNCSYVNIDNVSNTYAGFIYDFVNHTSLRTTGWGLKIEQGHDNHISNFTTSYCVNGLSFTNTSNCTGRDINVNFTSWDAVETNKEPHNISIYNVVANNTYHNSIDFHSGTDLYLENVSVYDPGYIFNVGESNGIIITGSGSDKGIIYNTTLKNIYCYSSRDMNVALTIVNKDTGYPLAKNIIVENLTSDGFHEGVEISATDGIKLTNVTTKRAAIGTVTNYNVHNCSIIDSNLSDCSESSVYLFNSSNVSLINTKTATNYEYPRATAYQSYLSYYSYPNIQVLNTTLYPVSGALITCNVSTLNGYGQPQSTFTTDVNGKLQYNRSNFLAVLEKTETRDIKYNFISNYYAPQLTASKNTHTNSKTIYINDSWYSPNPYNLAGILNTITLDEAGSTTKLIANFSSNVTFGYMPVIISFTDLSSGSPIAWKWSFGDGEYSTEKNPRHIYTQAGTYTVSLNESNLAQNNITTKTDYITVKAYETSDPHALDINKDGVVNIQDINIVTMNYGTTIKAPYPNWDVNQDGLINFKDLILIETHIGEKVA
jgi:PKD repeat protein